MKLKRKLIYSILLFMLSIILIMALTFGWFQNVINNDVEGFTFYYSGVVFNLFKSSDDNHDGNPDKNENNEIIYNSISSENIVIDHLFPLCSTAFKIDISAGSRGGYLNIVFQGLSEPDPLTPDVDLANVLKIRYTDPITSENVDQSLKDMMDENRNATLYSGYHITGTGDFSFPYTIYMEGAAGNEYKGKSLIIDKVIFFVTQVNPVGG